MGCIRNCNRAAAPSVLHLAASIGAVAPGSIRGLTQRDPRRSAGEKLLASMDFKTVRLLCLTISPQEAKEGNDYLKVTEPSCVLTSPVKIVVVRSAVDYKHATG